MGAFIDITGQRFGRLVALAADRRRDTSRVRVFWQCRCDCGREVTVQASNLSPHANCGCVRREGLLSRNTVHGYATRGSKERLYEIWSGMKKRCFNPRSAHFADYGGRGISVCAEWLDYTAFRDWALANGYRDDLTIDRWPDKDGDYEPSNCRWATWVEQANNRRPRRRGYHKRSKYHAPI